MYVLLLDSRPEAVAKRFQRLCMAMAGYSAEEQARMNIVKVSSWLPRIKSLN